MTPILWTFRRCPYAMRARLAILTSGQTVALREVLLRDKPDAFLATSPTATVPCLDTGAAVIDESLDIMLWALDRNDPEGWLNMPPEGHDLIARCDGPFKTALDLYKYAARHPDSDPIAQRAFAADFITALNNLLGTAPFLFGTTPKLADMAILPFVRQFAHVDLEWFAAQDWPAAIAWLERFKTSPRFAAIMTKYPSWTPTAPPLLFP